jgi:lipopolysaccharide export system protein LptA
VGLLVAIALTLRGRTPPESSAPPPSIDRDAAVVLPQGADIVWTDKGREVFTLKFQRALSYPDGRSVFTGADARIPARGGRMMRVTANEAEVRNPPGQQRSVFLKGNVILSSEDGLELKTDAANYSEQDRVVRIPGAFTYTRGRTSGSGRAATYDQTADVLVIREAARLKVAPDAEGTDALDVSARAATLDRRQHLLRFEGDAAVLRGNQTSRADTLLAFLSEDEQRLTRVELRGGSRIHDPAAVTGGLRSMEARDIDLSYADDGRTLRRAALRGQAAMELAGDGPAGRRLAGETIDAELGPDGQTLQRLDAQQRVRLDLPAEGDVPARRIEAASLAGTGGEGGLRRVGFTGAVTFRETRPAAGGRPALDRTAKSDRLDAELAPGLGAPERAVFRGRVTIHDGGTSAEAGVADYAPDRNLITLETPAGVAGPAPRVSDPQVTVSATWIELTLEPRRLHAKGDVRSVLKQSPGSPPPPAGAGAEAHEAQPAQKDAGLRRPVMLNDKDPINVTAQQLQYDGVASRGTYTGGARLWQGETTLQAETLVLDDKTGNLTATKQARTRMMLEQQDQKTDEPKLVESLGSSDLFVYEDAERRATYTGSAHLTGPQGDITAKRIELFLDEDGRTVQRAEAYDDVVAYLEGGQRASGSRLTYFGADERYVMTGTPVTILETVEGGCRETLGASLTFIRSTDTISVVGTEGNRSRTMPGRCAVR